jgi:tRNA-modifying protein YgfZ
MGTSGITSFDREYQALQSGAAVVALVGWSSVSVTGADRQAFLQSFCTNDVKRLMPGSCCETFLTNVKGKIVGHGWIWCRDDELLFVGAPGQGPRLVEHLDRYIIREDVKLRDTSGERTFVLIAGKGATETSHLSVPLAIISRDDTTFCELRHGEVASAMGEFVQHGFVIVGPEAFLAARIEAGLPLFGIDFDESNLPQEIGRDREAISFTKGCYLGQETVARIDALGHVNQKIVGIRFLGSESPKPGAEVALRDAKVGEVTSAALSPKLGRPLALAMVRRAANAAGTKLQSLVGECEVVDLPAAADMNA